jgi:hypothetical protein
LFNIVEDDGMERERAAEWAGDRLALAECNRIIISTIVEQAKTHTFNLDQDMAPLACLGIYQQSRIEWDTESENWVKPYLNILPDDAKQLCDELTNEGYVDKFRGTVTVQDTWNLAIDLAKRLYADTPEQEQEYEELRQAGNSGDEVRDTSGDTWEDACNENTGKFTVGDDSDDTSDGDQMEGRVISWKDVVLSDHNEWSESGQSNGGFGIDWDGFKDRSKVALMPTGNINVIDLKTSGTVGTGYYNSAEQYMGNHGDTRAFANRIRRYVQAEARCKVDVDKYHGKMNRSAIVRLAMPPVDGGDYNKRIFYDMKRATMKDTAIFVLTDWSGSMSGGKMEYAADASQRLVHTFERILRVPVALAAFSDRRSQCDIGYIKKFNTRGITQQEIADRFSKFYSWSSANNDADAVHWAYNELLKRKESRKLLIVLSDGAPTGSWQGNPGRALKYVTKKIEQGKRVELYGLGIMSDAVKQYYTNSAVVHRPEEINEALFTIIREGHYNVK